MIKAFIKKSFVLLAVFSNCAATNYNYDPLNRLTSATVNGSYVEYDYDKAGNLLEVKTPYTLSTTVLGAGSVADNLSKIDCGTDCDGVYGNSTSVTLTATPDSGNSFTGWSGSGCTGTSTCTINVTMQHTVQATFSGTSGNNPPEFTATGPFSVDENSPNGTFVGDIDAHDGDGGAIDVGLAYSITGGSGQNVFSINNTGVLIVANSSQLDYETNTSFSLTVNVFDGSLNANTNVVIYVNDLTEIAAPTITAPGNGLTVTTSTPQVEGTGLTGATVTVTGPQQQTCSAMVDNSEEWLCSLSPALQQGQNTVYASQVSNNGETSPSSSVTFTVDVPVTLPAPVILSPLNNANIGSNSFVISGTSEPGVGLKAFLYDGNTQLGEFCGSVFVTGTWSCPVTAPTYGVFSVEVFHYNTGDNSLISPSDSVVVNLIDPITDLIFENGFERIVPPINLNDTGIVMGGDYPSGNNSSCTSNFTSPQDCHQGRDFTHNDDSDGHAGFSFTKLDANGVPLSDQSVSYGVTPWACVKDNVTGLIWEVKSTTSGIHHKDNTYQWGGLTAIGKDHLNSQGTYYDPSWNDLVQGSNTESLCGFNDWRVPSVGELYSIVHLNAYPGPNIDINYFPNTALSAYWSSSPTAGSPTAAWRIHFDAGFRYRALRNGFVSVRLVHSP